MRPRVLALAAIAVLAGADRAAGQELELHSAGAPQAPAFRAGSGPADLAAAGGGVHVALGGTYDSSGKLLTPGGLLRVDWTGAVSEPIGPSTWGTAGATGVAPAPDGSTVVALSRSARVATVTGGAVASEQPLSSSPTDVAVTPDGSRWLTLPAEDRVVRVTPAGSTQAFVLAPRPPFASNAPSGATVDRAGRVWVALSGSERLAVIDPSATPAVAYVVLPAGSKAPAVALGPDGRVWASDEGLDDLHAVNPATREVASYQYPGLDRKLSGVAAGADGLVYFGISKGDAIGRIRTDGVFLGDVPTGLDDEKVEEVEPGGDGNVWFTVQSTPGRVGRIFLAPGASALAADRTAGGALRVTGTVHPRSKAAGWAVEFGTTTAYGQRVVGTVPAGPAPVKVRAELPEPPAGEVWHARLVAASSAGITRSADATVDPATIPGAGGGGPGGGTHVPPARPAPPAHGGDTPGRPETPATPAGHRGAAPPASADDHAHRGGAAPAVPELGRAVVVAPAKGKVLVTLPGRRTPVALGEADDIPFGAVLDTRHGTVRLTAAVDAAGRVQTADFWGGVFAVRQGAGVTELHLRGPAPTCARTGARAAAVKRRRVRRLWGKDDHGRFRTHGRDSVATVRGTTWLVEERCTGTLTRVTSGAVAVKDRRTGRTTLVKAGRSIVVRRAR